MPKRPESISIDGKQYKLEVSSLIESINRWSLILNDGHWTLMRFTSGFKAVMGTPDWTNDLWTIEKLKPFNDPIDAMLDLIKRLHRVHLDRLNDL